MSFVSGEVSTTRLRGTQVRPLSREKRQPQSSAASETTSMLRCSHRSSFGPMYSWAAQAAAPGRGCLANNSFLTVTIGWLTFQGRTSGGWAASSVPGNRRTEAAAILLSTLETDSLLFFNGAWPTSNREESPAGMPAVPAVRPALKRAAWSLRASAIAAGRFRCFIFAA
jgi:hypothetical protein